MHTEVAAIKRILCFGTEGSETRNPSIGLLLEHSVLRVNPSGPWPPGKYIWKKDSSRSTTAVSGFLQGRLSLDDGLLDGAVTPPADHGRYNIKGEVNEQA